MDDEEFHDYLLKWVEDGIEEGLEYYRDLMRPLLATADDLAAAGLEDWEGQIMTEALGAQS
jgi:hypothetical protein